jgi:hypothetical protein
MTDWTLEYWLWASLFVAGAFYMVIDISRRISGWVFSLVLPTRYTIQIGTGDEQNRVSVWAYSLRRAIIKAAAKDGYQYIMERIGWTPMPWPNALRLNLVWLAGYGWDAMKNIRSLQQGDIDSLIMMMVERCTDQPANCWANRRDLWLLCLRSAELGAKNPTGMEHQTIKRTCTPSTGSEKGAKLQEILPDQFDPDTRTCQMNPEQRAQAATVENMAGTLVGFDLPDNSS